MNQAKINAKTLDQEASAIQQGLLGCMCPVCYVIEGAAI